MRKPPPKYIANFDSATAFLRSAARFLKGKDFPALGQWPGLEALVPLINGLPRYPRELFYTVGGYGEAVRPDETDKVDAERLAQWATSLYPARRYPAVFIGSSSGALPHLCAAVGAPWLPQTLFIPVAQTEVHPDEARDGLEAGLLPGRALLEANPELQLHHMHDPNQDRLMLTLMTYFRVKRRRLGAAYERFLRERLQPGGVIVVVECRRSWKVTQVGERHVYQFGALGGATPEEFLHGGQRVAAYLERYKSHRRRWDPPPPNRSAPEAEWGYEPALDDDIERFARRHGFRVARVVFEEPEDLSPFVAELYRWWYARRNVPSSRLVVSSFILHEPWWTLRTGAVPFWCKFNMEPSADAIERYLDEQAAPFDHIHMMLFSHGVHCVGLVPIDRWRAVLARARVDGSFLGVNEEEYPLDFASFVRYHRAMQALPPRHAMPAPLPLAALAGFADAAGHELGVAWEGLDALERRALSGWSGVGYAPPAPRSQA